MSTSTIPVGARAGGPEVVARLRAAGCVFAEDEARLILGQARSAAEFERLLARRIDGEPLEVVLGWAEFRGLRIGVDPGVFVPRQRSGWLVEQALEFVRPGSLVVDLCCGTGALGLAVAYERPPIELVAADVDPAAVRCARRNLAAVGGRVFEGDLFAALPQELEGRIDVLLVNAPYVPTAEIERMPREAREHEPAVALDGGMDGVEVHRRVAREASAWLAPDGVVLVETSEQQAPLTVNALRRHGLRAEVTTDGDAATVVCAQRFTR